MVKSVMLELCTLRWSDRKCEHAWATFTFVAPRGGTTDTDVDFQVPQQLLDKTMASEILTAVYWPYGKALHFQRYVRGDTYHSSHLLDTRPKHVPFTGIGVTERVGRVFHRKRSRL